MRSISNWPDDCWNAVADRMNPLHSDAECDAIISAHLRDCSASHGACADCGTMDKKLSRNDLCPSCAETFIKTR